MSSSSAEAPASTRSCCPIRFATSEAVDLVLKRFTEKPTLASYQRLKRWTNEAGEWDEHRPRAIAVLEARGAARAEAVANRPDADQPAFSAVAGTHRPRRAHRRAGMGRSSRRRVGDGNGTRRITAAVAGAAAAVEPEHPLDAASAYARDVEAQIDTKQTRIYENAVQRVAHLRTLHQRAGDAEGFDSYLADLRHRHRPKSKLLRLLDQAGLTDPGQPDRPSR